MSREDWEVFDFIKAERQQKRDERRMSFEKVYAAMGWTRHHETHYSRIVNGRRLDYWPGPKKWRYNNKTMFGDVKQWLRKYDPSYKSTNDEAE